MQLDSHLAKTTPKHYNCILPYYHPEERRNLNARVCGRLVIMSPERTQDSELIVFEAFKSAEKMNKLFIEQITELGVTHYLIVIKYIDGEPKKIFMSEKWENTLSARNIYSTPLEMQDEKVVFRINNINMHALKLKVYNVFIDQILTDINYYTSDLEFNFITEPEHVPQLTEAFNDAKNRSINPEAVTIRHELDRPPIIKDFCEPLADGIHKSCIRKRVLNCYIISFIDRDSTPQTEVWKGWSYTTIAAEGYDPTRAKFRGGNREASVINLAKSYGITCVAKVDKKHKLHKKVSKQSEINITMDNSFNVKSGMDFKLGNQKMHIKGEKGEGLRRKLKKLFK